MPPDTVLTPRPDVFPAWDSLSENERKLYARQMEVYAGFQENADHNVGRLLDAIEEMGELDNTLVIYIFGDNGASLEGTVTGSFNELTMPNGITLTARAAALADRRVRRPRRLGDGRLSRRTTRPPGRGPATRRSSGASRWAHTSAARATAWSFRWPRRISDCGGHRSQFTHCIDLGPTILEAAGIPQPRRSSTASSRSRCTARASSTPSTTRGPPERTHGPVLRDRRQPGHLQGRLVGVRQARPRSRGTLTVEALAKLAPGVYDPEQDTWELYYLPDDFSQAHDLAAEHPDKLAELKELFWEEAEKYKVLPLLGGLSLFFGILPPMPTATRTTFYGDVENVASGMIPRIYGRSYAIEADLSIPEGGAEGVIVAEADDMGGFSLWVDDERRLTPQLLDDGGLRVLSRSPRSRSRPGTSRVRMQFDADETKPGTGGAVTLWADGKQIGGGRMDHTVAMRFSVLRRHGRRLRQRHDGRSRATATRRPTRSPAR